MNTYHTTDGGQTWALISEEVGTSVISVVSFSNEQIGWVGLDWPGDNPVIEKTVNGGQNWDQQPLSLPSGVSSVSSVVTDAPILIGANGLLPTHINSLQTKLALYTTHDSSDTWNAGTLANFDRAACGMASKPSRNEPTRYLIDTCPLLMLCSILQIPIHSIIMHERVSNKTHRA